MENEIYKIKIDKYLINIEKKFFCSGINKNFHAYQTKRKRWDSLQYRMLYYSL